MYWLKLNQVKTESCYYSLSLSTEILKNVLFEMCKIFRVRKSPPTNSGFPDFLNFYNAVAMRVMTIGYGVFSYFFFTPESAELTFSIWLLLLVNHPHRIDKLKRFSQVFYKVEPTRAWSLSKDKKVKKCGVFFWGGGVLGWFERKVSQNRRSYVNVTVCENYKTIYNYTSI